jgi:hypothetical protein
MIEYNKCAPFFLNAPQNLFGLAVEKRVLTRTGAVLAERTAYFFDLFDIAVKNRCLHGRKRRYLNRLRLFAEIRVI